MTTATCRFCATPLRTSFADLGTTPLSNAFIHPDQADRPEPVFPLHAYVCDTCRLVQLEPVATPADIFSDYIYFSSYADSWLRHAETYAAAMVRRFNLTPRSLVVEVASNDGYLLQYFAQRGMRVLGIDPAANVAKAAEARGVPTLVEFFGRDLAEKLAVGGRRADLVIGNNVLAQVPDLNDFVAGVRVLLQPDGVATFEFPHLLRLMRENQFDTIYHEHFSYFSLLTAQRIFAAHRLRVFDVEPLWSHGGSLRLYLCHDGNAGLATGERVEAVLDEERAAGLDRLDAYAGFAEQVRETKRKLLDFLIAAKRAGKRVAGYGAPGKGNTLLNYCGIRQDFLDYTVDRNPYKHGRFTPGTHIPIHAPEQLRLTRPDYVLILPWNLKDEIMAQHAYIRDWGGRFIVPIPEVRVE